MPGINDRARRRDRDLLPAVDPPPATVFALPPPPLLPRRLPPASGQFRNGFPVFKRVLDPLERLALSAQLEKRFTLRSSR